MELFALFIFGVLLVIFLTVFVMDFIRNKKSKNQYHKGEVITAYVLLIPAVLLAFTFVLLPIFLSLSYSFTDYHRLKTLSFTDMNFVGFDNFVKLFKDKEVLIALRNTGIFVVLVVPIQILLALLLALFCNNKRKGTIIFKVCFFAPVAISLSVTSFLWLTILSPNPAGIMNAILGVFGVPAQDFLGQENSVLIWMVIMSAWQGCGFQMLIFLSALGNIRKDLYEAAKVDGSNAFHRFFTITLPGLKPTMLYILITVFVGACRVLIQPKLLTGYATRSVTLSYYMYEVGYTRNLIGYSCALAFVMTIVMGTITLIQRKLLGEKKR